MLDGHWEGLRTSKRRFLLCDVKNAVVPEKSIVLAQDLLLDWYRRHGRKHLPWRSTRDPYKIVVSEVMLAQTQVERVLPKFETFVRQFPTFAALAGAPTADVLRAWRGLGYNSRAVRLRALAMHVTAQHGGTLPRDGAALRRLPGIGAYTVAAIRAFAYGEDDAALDTNVRRIVHRVFNGIEIPARVSAHELNRQAARFMPAGRAHDWNSALMDLGSIICTARAPKCLICPLRSVCIAAPLEASKLDEARKQLAAKASRPQQAFKKSTRFVRGRLIDRLRELPEGQKVSLLDLQSELRVQCGELLYDVEAIIEALRKDGLVKREIDGVALAD